MNGQIQQEFNQLFASLNPDIYNEVLSFLGNALIDSKNLLSFEAKIKEVYQGDNAGNGKRVILCILLKNSLKDNLVYLKDKDPEELQLIQRAFYYQFVHTELDYLSENKKLRKEFHQVVSSLIVNLFNQDASDTQLLQELVQVFSAKYSYHNLRMIIKVFEDANDDRLWQFVPKVLPATIGYLSQIQDNKLLYCVWLMMQNSQWTVGVDQQKLDACLNSQTLAHILQFTIQNSYNVAYYQQGQAYIGKKFLQQKRYSAKILTLIFRDFSTQISKKVNQDAVKEVYQQSVKILIYFLPFYLQMITFNPALNDIEKSFNDFEMEFQSLIVQALSLISTLVTQQPTLILKDSSTLTQPLLYTMFGYSLMGIHFESLFQEDQNLFLTAFFDDNEDEMSNVSIRSVVTEVLTEAFAHKEFKRQLLSETIQAFFRGLLPDLIAESHEKKLYIGSLKNISEINVTTDICIPNDKQIQFQELAVFILGSQIDCLPLTVQMIESTLSILQNGAAFVILKLRALWLFEKAYETFQSKPDQAKMIFQAVSEMFINNTEFILSYQCLKTLHKYLKIINIRQEYPQLYQNLLCQFIIKTNTMIIMCNDETIHVPIEGLAFLSKQDSECCAKTASEVMPRILDLYKKYYQDGMLGDDIVELMKTWACIPNNDAFLKVIFPHIYQTIKAFQEHSLANNIEQTQKMLSILTSYMMANSASLSQKQNQQIQQVVNIFKMLLDILNSTKDIYTTLYTILCLSAFCQAFPHIAKEYRQFIDQVVRKIIVPGTGLDDSSCMFLGHLLVVLMDKEILDAESQKFLLEGALLRLAKTQMPSIMKVIIIIEIFFQSFVLPISFCIVKFGTPMIDFLFSREGVFKNALTNWLQNYQMFQGEFVKKISKLALITLLDSATQNLQIASLRIRMSAYSLNETDLLTRLVYILVKDIVVPEPSHGQIQEEDDDEEYGDDYGDEEIEDNKEGFEYPKDDFGGNENTDTENKDEKLLMSGYLWMIQHLEPLNNKITQTLVKAGKATLNKIIAVEFEGEHIFSRKEIEVIKSLFM